MVLMVVDAAFTSIGFTAVVPKVEVFSKKFVETGKIKNLRDLAEADRDGLRTVWKNKRSWVVATNTAAYPFTLSVDDRSALRTWARNAKPENWREDPHWKNQSRPNHVSIPENDGWHRHRDA